MAITIEVKNEVAEVTHQDEQIPVEVEHGSVVVEAPKTTTRISEVTLLADAWVGDASPYTQVVNIVGVTENSRVDLTPTGEQLEIFRGKDLALTAKNVGGVVTVYAIGDKPTGDHVMQVRITEVNYE